MKTAISIPDPIFTAAENLAKQMNLSRSTLYTKAVEHFIQSYAEEYITEELNRVYSLETSQLDPVLQKLQFQSLLKEEW